MFNNLNAEQARNKLTDKACATHIGITRESYLRKKKTHNFKFDEIIKLCELFNSEFDYLFATDQDKTAM